MRKKPLSVAVTGLNATDNPGPGVGVLRCLRDAKTKYRLIGLAYDALDPGVYATAVADEVFMIPYPSQGIDAFLARMEYIRSRVGIDVIIPTLDAELPSFIETEGRLRALGIRCLLPTRKQLDGRAKMNLGELGAASGISVPCEAVVGSAEELYKIHERVPYPFFVKGPYYGATIAHNVDEAVGAWHKAMAQWGAPVIVQQAVDGEEFNVVAVGDGRGGLVGAVPMKKMVITDKGKGWAGITVKDPELVAVATKFMRSTAWPGPCEIEVMRDRRGVYQLLEINPRFPAWVYLSSAAGINLADAVVRIAAGIPVDTEQSYQVGTMFVRISLDQVVRLGDFQEFVTTGEVLRSHGGAR